MHKYEHIQEAKEYILKHTETPPTIGLILGSGLGGLANDIEQPVIIPYSSIPHFAMSTVESHVGQLVIGRLEGNMVVAMQGRFHYYEGHTLDAVTFPVRVMKEIGVETIIMTNASGAINKGFKPGDLMLVTDHINLMGVNPLIGPNDDRLGVRFPDLSSAYHPSLCQLARKVAQEQQIELQEGVYVACSGPSFETPAEIKMMRTLGGDAVGMSTVPEVIVANHAGLRVMAISCVSNMAAGILDQPITAEEVFEAAGNARNKFVSLLRGIMQQL
ncbi:MAG: purine-nucleoside phosphorylase [Clostridia bacterium]